MGRIDDALRRTEETVGQSSPGSAVASEDVFVSPWRLRDGSPNRIAELLDEHGVVEGTVVVPSGEVCRLRGFSDAWIERLVVAPNPEPLLIEQMRQLAATLHQAQTTSGLKIVLLTSAEPNEGKSLTAMNLALTLSESYKRRVLLIDADLRRPSLHEIAQVPNISGLGETLRSVQEQKVTAVQLSDHLMLVPAGRPDKNPMSALTSPRMKMILEDAASRYDWVLIDAPPIGAVADSSLLAPMADAVLLVVRAGRTAYQGVLRAVDAIGRERILGVVLNGMDYIEASPYRRYYAAYLPESTSRS